MRTYEKCAILINGKIIFGRLEIEYDEQNGAFIGDLYGYDGKMYLVLYFADARTKYINSAHPDMAWERSSNRRAN